MAQEVVIKSSVDLGDSPQQVQSLRSEYTQAFKELGNLQRGSVEYYEQLKKTAALKGEMRELREEIKALDPREQIRLIGGLAKSAAGGFEAATGAVALFAGKNEELEKTLLKVNAAIAVTHGLQEFTEGARRAKALWGVFTSTLNAAAAKSKSVAAATKALTIAQKEGNAASIATAEAQKAQAIATDGATLSTKLLGGAMKALGIGLIIAAIAYLVDNWKALKKEIEREVMKAKEIHGEVSAVTIYIDPQVFTEDSVLDAMGFERDICREHTGVPYLVLTRAATVTPDRPKREESEGEKRLREAKEIVEVFLTISR